MNSGNFDPNDITVPNGSFFGFPYSIAEADLILLPVPWDVTTSYRPGTAQGSQAILDASVQLDWYDCDLPQAWQTKCATIPISSFIQEQNHKFRAIAEEVINHLETGGKVSDQAIAPHLAAVNQASIDLNNWVYNQVSEPLEQKKIVGVVGGDHSVPLGLMTALAEKHPEYGILQIDAHADLRQAYEGFVHSHASIMDNALKIPNITHLVQVGVRDLCEAEMTVIKSDPRITLFADWQLKANSYQGTTWAAQCQEIINHLPEHVYISFDIDGLNPAYCPHTGTPVPGGLEFDQAIYLLRSLLKAGKKIIGFDLCEVAPGANGDEWDGNVGARILYKLVCLSQIQAS